MVLQMRPSSKSINSPKISIVSDVDSSFTWRPRSPVVRWLALLSFAILRLTVRCDIPHFVALLVRDPIKVNSRSAFKNQ